MRFESLIRMNRLEWIPIAVRSPSAPVAGGDFLLSRVQWSPDTSTPNDESLEDGVDVE